MRRNCRLSRTPEPLERRVLLAASVVINEIHYDPDVKTEQVEFIELHNPGDQAFDLSGASFTNGVSYTFPAGASLPAGGYLVVAENAAEFQSKFGVIPAGQWVGSLDNDGEKITLKNAAGATLDEVNYDAGFPWPTVGVAPGYSIELINPTLDNDIGGSWRSGVPSGGGGPGASTVLFQPGSPWHYRKGTSEASNPIGAWRGLAFTEDATWAVGATPIGYDSTATMGTPLADMNNGYTSVFLRKTFTITDPSQVGSLKLDASYDDGFNVWINGSFRKSVDVPGENMAFSDTSGQAAREDANFYSHVLSANGLIAGTNVIAVQVFNVSINQSSDAFFDARLTAQAAGAGGGSNPSPGRVNGAWAPNAPPQMRQVDHTPNQPTAGQAVTITTKVTDPNGIASVVLKYQLVNPGDYISKEDPRYEDPGNWTSVTMFDNGTNGDAAAGDEVYTAVLPGSLQTNRRLVRYRITTTDTLGASVTGPYADDEEPNFAYYVYNGVPSWTGADRPGATAPVTYSSDVLNSLPTYQLITTRRAHEESQYIPNSTAGGYTGDNYLWSGALVYDGKVYDHIHFRPRGGVHRFDMGKNMWKFDFNRNHDFEARDAFGNKYPVEWTKLNLGAVIQQGSFGQRGEQGLFEYVGFKLFNLTGLPASNTLPIAFRIVESASETGATGNQFDDDFQGLYLAVEQDDGAFLDSHGLPDGNFYKMESGPGGGTKNNQGATASPDNSDLIAFTGGYSQAQPESWWRQNLDLESYYSYRAIIEGIHHYDVVGGKNYFYYHNPVTNKWQVIPWDLDLTWADNMYGDGNEPLRDRVLPQQAFRTEYRNRLRDLRDLLFNPEQTGQLIDEYANLVDRPGDANSFADADRAMWDYNPILASGYVNGNAGQGRFYQAAVAPGGFRGMAQRMKNYVAQRGAFIDGTMITAADEAAAPRKGLVSYIGPANFPADQLRFNTLGFAPGNAGGSFAAMQWRIADITPVAPGQPRYEVNAAWQSGDVTTFNSTVTIPSTAVTPGHTYRVRVRFKDTNGRWGHWSDVAAGASQFTVGGGSTAVKDSLRITELNYNPTPAGLGTGFNADDFEFVELKNIGPAPINLQDVRFTGGIEYTFGNVTLAAGEVGVVVRNLTAFQYRYGTAPGIRVLGSYAGSPSDNFANGGEPVTLVDASNQTIHAFAYDDDPTLGWYTTTDGAGYTLTVMNPLAAPADWNSGAGWRASRTVGGTPGYDESATAGPAVVAASFDHASAAPRLRVSFDRDVFASVSGGDLTVRTLPGNQPVAVGSYVYDRDTNTVTFTLGSDGSLPNGDYRATLSGAGVTDGSGSPLPADFVLPFYVLAGDVNRDRRVDGTDFAILAGNFGKAGMSYEAGDVNGDGSVNGSDFALLAGNFGRTLPSPPPVAPAAGAVVANSVAAAPEQTAAPRRRVVAPAPKPTLKSPVVRGVVRHARRPVTSTARGTSA